MAEPAFCDNPSCVLHHLHCYYSNLSGRAVIQVPGVNVNSQEVLRHKFVFGVRSKTKTLFLCGNCRGVLDLVEETHRDLGLIARGETR